MNWFLHWLYQHGPESNLTQSKLSFLTNPALILSTFCNANAKYESMKTSYNPIKYVWDGNVNIFFPYSTIKTRSSIPGSNGTFSKLLGPLLKYSYKNLITKFEDELKSSLFLCLIWRAYGFYILRLSPFFYDRPQLLFHFLYFLFLGYGLLRDEETLALTVHF